MFKRLTLLVVLVMSTFAAAQGIRRQSQVLISGGFPNATVRVCTEPATGIPCTPLANIYSDPGLTQPLSNPLTSDASGNYAYFGGIGLTYHEQITGNGLQEYDVPYITLPLSSASLLAANNTWTGVQNFGGVSSLDGYQFVDGVINTTIQSAIGKLPTNGGTVIIPASSTEYACPTSIPGNVALVGLGSFAENNFVGSIITSTTKTQVLIGPCGVITVASGVQNVRLQNLTLDFNDSGYGLAFVSSSFMQFYGVTLLNCGGASVDCLLLSSTGANGLLNSIRNVFDHVSIKCSSVNTCRSAIYLNGSANTGTTDNAFTDITISGSPKCGIELEKNTDSNQFVYGNYMPDTIVGSSAPFCFNLTNPTVDIDADASEFLFWSITGTPTWTWNSGQSQGHIFLGINTPPPNSTSFHVAGGTPLYPAVLTGGGGVGANTFSVTSLQVADSGQCTLSSGVCPAQGFHTGSYPVPPLCTLTWSGAGTLTGILKAIATTNSLTPTSTVTTGGENAVINWTCQRFPGS